MTGNMVLNGSTVYSKTSFYSSQNTGKKNTTGEVSFADKMYAVSSTTSRKQNVKTSAVDDFINRHPNDRYQVEKLVNAGNNVLSQYGRDDVNSMTMDEYKEYIYGVLDKIPFDASQQRDTQFIDITEDGWEQMKNDPKYEAWVVGYFKVDRSVKIPFANYPGVEPRIHTEHFGASIDEHLGQSYPQSSATGNEKDSEDWWKKRQERHEQNLEEAQEQADKKEMLKKHKSHIAVQHFSIKGASSINGKIQQMDAEDMSAAASFFAMIAQGGGGSGGTAQ